MIDFSKIRQCWENNRLKAKATESTGHLGLKLSCAKEYLEGTVKIDIFQTCKKLLIATHQNTIPVQRGAIGKTSYKKSRG